MADRIHANTEWLDKCARDLSSIEQSISSVAGQLAGIKLRKDEGGNLKVSLTCRLRMTGANFSGSSATDDIRQLQRATAVLTSATAAFSGSARQAAQILGQAENKAVQLMRGTGLGTVAEIYKNGSGVKPEAKFTPLEKKPAATRDEYYERCEDRRQHAIDDECARLYDRYKDQLVIGDDQSPSSYYSPSTKKIQINWKDDRKNPRGECCTYFHETGHMIDDYIKDKGDASSSKAFTQKLKQDFDNYVAKVMKEHNCSKDKAYEIISDWLYEDADNKNGVSDLCGGLSNKQCEGKWGHKSSYWAQGKEHGVPEKVNNEAFAHFFEASMSTDSKKLDYIKEVFPTAYEEFKKIVRKAH